MGDSIISISICQNVTRKKLSFKGLADLLYSGHIQDDAQFPKVMVAFVLGVTYNNACEAKCGGTEPPTQGSCDKCEFPCFRQAFTPVCSADQQLFFPNKCHATCAGYGDADLADCALSRETVIPGKTKLPPNAPPLQGLDN